MQVKLEQDPRMPNPDQLQAAMTQLFSDNEQEKKAAWATLNEAQRAIRKQSPGFFTPYKSFGDFGTSLAGPIVAPVVLGLLAGVAAIVAAVGTVTGVVSLFVTAGAALARDGETTNNALAFAAISGIAVAAAALAIIAAAVLAAVITPLAIAGIFTRSGATVVSAASDAFSKLAGCCTKPEADQEPVLMVPSTN